MSIATVVTRGFGTGSYAEITKLPTLGYSQAAAIIVSTGTPDVEFKFRNRSTVCRFDGRSATFKFLSVGDVFKFRYRASP